MRALPLLVAASVIAAPASADTLADALRAAYETNPELAAARAAVRRADENMPIARAEMRPNIGGSVTFSQDLDDELNDFGRVTVAGFRVTQPVWAGGRVQAQLSAADARIGAAREILRSVENRIIADTVEAYAEVLATREEVRLNQNQVKVLREQLRASSDRFEVGDVTRTDVAQSQARLADAEARLVAAQGNALTAEQTYIRLVGRPPGELAALPPLPPLPPSVEAARDLALASAPVLIAARYDEKAAAEQVRAIRRERWGTASVNASFGYQIPAGGPFEQFRVDGLVGGINMNASIPIYTAGLLSARTRQAEATQSEAIETIESTERTVLEQTTNAWIAIETAKSVIRSARASIDANRLAAEGVRQENLVGSRDIIEVLNAEQELLNSQVVLVRAERNLYAATYRLLQVIGRAEAAALGITDKLYDPAVNFRRVNRSWREWREDPDPRTDRQRNRPDGAREPAAVAPPPLSVRRMGPPAPGQLE
ncbi:TolC family outer membrane protein [Thermaurantiacus sp.]